MKYFFDTEFIDYARKLHIISIGIISEDNRTLYNINVNCEFRLASDWVQKNVLAQLPGFDSDGIEIIGEGYGHLAAERVDRSLGWCHSSRIAKNIIDFVGDDNTPEFWADYGAYDWVVLCNIFGGMLNLPKHFPMYVQDLQQLKRHLGIEKIPIPEIGEHHALNDAKTLKLRYEWLIRG